jgi:hypothetical protein
MLADRRLSFTRKPPIETGRKIYPFETLDGAGFLGYAGVGSCTGLGTEPSDWMARVLRGRDLTLDASLEVLAGAINARLGLHARAIGTNHSVIAPCFLNGKPQIREIELTLGDKGSWSVRHINWIVEQQKRFGQNSPVIAPRGSGAVVFEEDRNHCDCLRKILKAHDRGRMTIGPKSIVIWRSQDKIGELAYLSGTELESDPTAFEMLPRTMRQFDATAITKLTMEYARKLHKALLRGERPDPADYFKTEEFAEKLSHLPSYPDDKLE